jgi:hypothetical protein
VTGVIVLSTFPIGWWLTVIIAYLVDVKVSTAMKGTLVGLLIGAFVFWSSYEGLVRWIPNPPIITDHVLKQNSRQPAWMEPVPHFFYSRKRILQLG